VTPLRPPLTHFEQLPLRELLRLFVPPLLRLVFLLLILLFLHLVLVLLAALVSHSVLPPESGVIVSIDGDLSHPQRLNSIVHRKPNTL